MSQGGADTCPQVFVVDSQVSHIAIPSVRKSRWAKDGWKFILLLVGFSMLGMITEGVLIYNLYKKTEVFNLCGTHPLCHNLSNASPLGKNEDGTISKQVGSKEHNWIPSLQTQTRRRPFAHLFGSIHVSGKDNVVLWENAGESVIQNMTHDKGLLIVQQPGYYYLYSKLQLEFVRNCSLTEHKVMRNTSAYGKPMELMKSKNNHCGNTNGPSKERKDLLSSFLAGIFELQQGDRIFVTLDKIQSMRLGRNENFIGAFMISP
ncbi:tumor necrosis factor ligand superfamily member 14 [Melanotaenia boesemani]|uniref:tumor necrosis factor ligand superfamily member 14 n=1 Tax=Melanotaenia boesemani TaxID=1250792 RepID=UPI001C05E128|nr:tumor necrosis factor ligand superfamily member 14 [Melanotaenia boesemani]